LRYGEKRSLLFSHEELQENVAPNTISTTVGKSLIFLECINPYSTGSWATFKNVSFRKNTHTAHIGKQGTNLTFLNGRLLCDLVSDGAKVLTSICALSDKTLLKPGYNFVDHLVTNGDVWDTLKEREAWY
jgi:hypothetical protein